jgi:hypothetical protein
VSHLKERKEKNCLNCQATLYGRYCHNCGQENLEPKETVWHLIQHFFNDISHFDGKFFATVKYLLRKPGFLSTEYAAGRRASYLNPIRMYVFTSAIFFLILYAINRPEQVFHPEKTQRMRGVEDLKKSAADRARRDSVLTDVGDRKAAQDNVAILGMEIRELEREYGDSTTQKFSDQELSTVLKTALYDSLRRPGLSAAGHTWLKDRIFVADHPLSGSNFFGWDQGRFNTMVEYDSTQRALPDSLRDGWLKRTMMRRLVAAGEEYQRDPDRYKEKVWENLMHSFPKILFVSLPFFALILNMLYFRRKKQFYYVNHGIFAIHVYCATFLLLLICMLLSVVKGWVDVGWLRVLIDILETIICIYNFIYLYKAMRGFYKQRRAKTLLKYFITCCLAFVINLVLFVIFALLSAINI